MKPLINDFTLEELTLLITEMGEPAYRGKQIFQMIYKQLIFDPSEFSNISKELRNKLAEQFCFEPLGVEKSVQSSDGQTNKFLFRLQDDRMIEAVLMRYRDRNTICISTQVGCPMNCAFCATATLGFKRNLTANEIVQQVILALDNFGPHQAHSVNLVFMGMGEALMNIDNVMKAIDILSHPQGLNIPVVRMTLSTSGVLSELPKLRDAKNRPNLAVSINATTDDVRSQLMPVNCRFPLSEIHKALLDWPYRSHEKVLLEYVLLENVNDSDEDACRLAEFAKDLPHNINIIPYNETPRDRFHAPSTESVQRFIKILQDLGCLVTLRVARGVQVGGACGQLMAMRQNNKH